MKSLATVITLPHILSDDSLHERKNRQIFVTGTEMSDGLTVKNKKMERTRLSSSC